MKKYWSILCALALAWGGGEPVQAQTIKEEGRVAKTVWSGYWWPTAKQEILRPLAKYDRLTGARSVDWEKANNPPNVPSWVGLCHGWAAAAVMEDEPTRALRARDVVLGVGDQKAWLSLAHGDDVANFYGLRYDGPEDDLNDMAPETLWEALRTSIGEQKTAIVLDIEPGEQVWNFPVYAYRVEATKVRDVYRGKIYVWLADDHVPADFVGVKRLVQAYPFEIGAAVDGTPLHGTGRWVGAAVKAHPDFAWVPYVVRSGNDELSYEQVCKLLGRSPRGGEAPTIAPETAPNDAANDENETVANNENEAAANNENETVANNENEAAANDGNETVANNDEALAEGIVAFSELEGFMRFVQAKGSDFDFDIRPEGLRREFAVGDVLTLTGISQRDGYLNVVAIDPNGDLIPLYPLLGEDNKIKAGEEFKVPGDASDYLLRCAEPIGDHRIQAFVTERPIRILADPGGESGEDGSKKIVDLNSLLVRRAPSEKGTVAPEKRDGEQLDVGYCAYDETTVYIGKKEASAPTEAENPQDEKTTQDKKLDALKKLTNGRGF